MSLQLTRGRASDTIFAAASGSGRAAITVMRVSGDAAARVLSGLAGEIPQPRRASLRAMHRQDGSLLDRGLVLWFPAPNSYTGEDICELHLHGGRAVANAVAGELLRLGCRPADPGEFTRRAFTAGRMDLLEAEAIGDLVSAETESQRVQALAALQSGALGIVRGWSERLLHCLARQEAIIDFPDETAEAGESGLTQEALAVAAEIDRHLAQAVCGERVRSGVRIAIVGAPNVGKSSLLNALARREASIVSAMPGTTRDVVEIHLDLDGIAVILSDTAGLRDSDDAVELEGMRRTRLAAEAADLVLQVIDSDADDALPYAESHCLVVRNKIDLWPSHAGACGVSAHTGQGLDELRGILADEARRLTQGDGGALLTHARQIAALRDTRDALLAAVNQDLPELRGEDLRAAVSGLGRLTGQVGAEQVLDVVFGSFCIGK